MAKKSLPDGLVKFKNVMTCYLCGIRITEGFQKVGYSPGGPYLVQWCVGCREDGK